MMSSLFMRLVANLILTLKLVQGRMRQRQWPRPRQEQLYIKLTWWRMCPQSKKNSHWRKILVRSFQQTCSRSVQMIVALIVWPLSSPSLLPVQVVLPALVSLNLAQAQLFGSRPSRPTFVQNNNQIVDEVLAELSPTIAQVNTFCHYSSHSNFTWLRLSPRLSGVWTITGSANLPARLLPRDPWSPTQHRPNTSSSTRSPMTGPRPTSSRRKAETGWRWSVVMDTSTPLGLWLLSGMKGNPVFWQFKSLLWKNLKYNYNIKVEYSSYTAGVDGYQESRERKEGAVQIAPAPARDVAPQPARGSLDSDAIIRQVLAALQPAIRESVQSAISG